MRNRWELFEVLKGSRILKNCNIEKQVKNLSREELEEGVIEYLLMKRKELMLK